MSPPAITTDGLTKHYRTRAAVDRLTMTVPAGSVTGFVGPNGAGKTTTIRMLLGLIRPTAGDAWVLGHPLADASRYLRRVGSLVDGPAFYPRLSGRANLAVLARLAGIASEIDRVLELSGLAERADDPVADYSLGMRQRLALAAALLPQPQLVILDEPANGLDPAGIRETRRLLAELAERGISVLVSSHQLAELEQVSEHLVLLRAGRLVYQGRLADLLHDHAGRITARPERLDQVAPLHRIASDRGWTSTSTDAAVTIEAAPDAAAELNRLAHAHGITLAELTSRPPSLEEIFFALTEEGDLP